MQKSCTVLLLGVLALSSTTESCRSTSQFKESVPATNTPATVPALKVSNSSSFTAMEQSVYQQVNQYRRSHSLSPLTLNARISEQARFHSQAMANGRVAFGHDGFEQRVTAIAKSIPYRAAAENVAFNQGYSDPATEAVQGWIKSAGHRQNMEGRYDLTGIGIAKNAKGEYYFTQLFIKGR